MSQIFHKSCYTSRSSGYKYRTLSTNTGDKKRRGNKDETTFDKKFRELEKAIACRIDKQLSSAQGARQAIKDKLLMIESKVDLMVELQNTVTSLRKNLQDAENSIADMVQKLLRIEAGSTVASDSVTLRSKISSFRSQAPIFEIETLK